MVVGVDEQLKMSSKLIMAGVVVAFNGGIFDGAVHALDLAIRPRVVWLCQAVFDPMLGADTIEQVTCKPCCWPIAIAWWMAELDAVIGQNGVEPVREGVDQITQELACDHPGRFGLQSNEGELGCAVDPNEQLKLAFLGPHFRNVDVNVTDRVSLEF